MCKTKKETQILCYFANNTIFVCTRNSKDPVVDSVWRGYHSDAWDVVASRLSYLLKMYFLAVRVAALRYSLAYLYTKYESRCAKFCATDQQLVCFFLKLLRFVNYSYLLSSSDILACSLFSILFNFGRMFLLVYQEFKDNIQSFGRNA